MNQREARPAGREQHWIFMALELIPHPMVRGEYVWEGGRMERGQFF